MRGALDLEGLQLSKERNYKVYLGYSQAVFGGKNTPENLVAVLQKMDQVLGQWQAKLKSSSGNLKIEGK
ncbi:MAG: hypothetical protein HQL22_12615 [Candidatus Omnitrophica bacterium]|nr:hypothetical protein [Candidatus Omnitrophota bacterium]